MNENITPGQNYGDQAGMDFSTLIDGLTEIGE